MRVVGQAQNLAATVLWVTVRLIEPVTGSMFGGPARMSPRERTLSGPCRPSIGAFGCSLVSGCPIVRIRGRADAPRFAVQERAVARRKRYVGCHRGQGRPEATRRGTH